ncbi:MAG: hypothetical protein V2A34_12345 [Lentisphaerota bacterium]
MKKIAGIMAAVWLAGVVAMAQHVPDRMNYQALLTDYHGIPLAATSNTMYFRIYDEAEGGNLIWGESQSIHTSTSGLFSVVLGSGQGLGERTEVATLQEAFEAGSSVDSRYLELQAIGTNGAIQPPMLPRQRFLTVPYTFQANDAQEAKNGFRVSGALYAQTVGSEVDRLIMNNTAASIATPGGLTVDAYGKSGVRVTFASNSSVRATGADAIHTRGNLTVNGAWTVNGAPMFRQALNARDPTLAKGARVRGGFKALGAYQKIASSTSSIPSRSSSGDGFLLVYLKTDSWDDDAQLIITVNGAQIPLQHHASTGGAKQRDYHFYSTACIPIAKGESWYVNFNSDTHSHSKFDAYWIPFGY